MSKLSCPPGTSEAFFWDSLVVGFGLRIRASGVRRWIVQYRASGAQRRAILGDPNTVGLDQARDKARELLAEVRLGGDPQGLKKAARRALSVSMLADAYLAVAAKQLRPRTFDAVKRHLQNHAKPLHHRPAETIERSEIAELLGEVARTRGPIAANRVRASLSAAWTWAIMEGLQQNNPIHGTLVRPEASRERTLSDAELAAIWNGTATGSDYDRITRLLMLTGCRRDEIGRMKWSEISGDLLVVPGARTKNHLSLEVPLVSLALEQLPQRRPDNDAVFGERQAGYSGWSRSKARLDGRIKLASWTLHDLRRTLSTCLSEMGVAPHYIEALLNHVSGAAKRGVAGTYNRALYREQKRAALTRWADHIAAITVRPR